MKTTDASRRALENILRLQSSRSRPILWIMGPQYMKRLSESPDILGEGDITISVTGIRSIKGVPVKVEQHRIKPNEAVLITEKDYGKSKL